MSNSSWNVDDVQDSKFHTIEAFGADISVPHKYDETFENGKVSEHLAKFESDIVFHDENYGSDPLLKSARIPSSREKHLSEALAYAAQCEETEIFDHKTSVTEEDPLTDGLSSLENTGELIFNNVSPKLLHLVKEEEGVEFNTLDHAEYTSGKNGTNDSAINICHNQCHNSKIPVEEQKTTHVDHTNLSSKKLFDKKNFNQKSTPKNELTCSTQKNKGPSNEEPLIKNKHFHAMDNNNEEKHSCNISISSTDLTKTEKFLSNVKDSQLSSSKKRVVSLSDFEVGVTLGTGSFGRVKFCTHKMDGSHWAIKILIKSEVIRMQQVEHIMNEKNILARLSHPFVVKIAGTFHDDRYLYVVLEYVIGGEFFTHLRRAHRFDDKTAMFYAAHVMLIFEYLHEQDTIYRDLKPENLLLDSEGFLKITDFGFAKIVPFKTYTLCGTPEYIAPEVLLNKGHGKGVDWWTLGILIYEMLVGQPPFVDDDPLEIYEQVLKGKFTFPKYVSSNAKSLIKKLLTADLTKRYGCMKGGAKDVKSHKWVAHFDFELLLARKMEPPIKPQTSGSNDTSQFDLYPESEEEASLPDIFELESDPFFLF